MDAEFDMNTFLACGWAVWRLIARSDSKPKGQHSCEGKICKTGHVRPSRAAPPVLRKLPGYGVSNAR